MRNDFNSCILVPGARRVGVLLNPANAVNAQTILSEVETAARALGLQIQVLNATTISEIDTVFEILKRERPDVLFVSGDPLFNNRRLQLALLAARNEIAASYSSRDYPEYGGLMSYGADVTDAFRQVGDYVGRIIKGAKPADLPLVQASKFELVINSQAARLLALNMPPRLLTLADEVLE
jgi:putative ABC transport system substrate-binding protein